jgi:hypothetical protein
MSRPFQPTTHNRPCPICQDVSGDCRLTSSGNILCHSTVSGEGDSTQWKYLRIVEPAPWGLYVPRQVRYSPASDALAGTIAQANKRKSREQRRQLQHALPAPEFDATFKRLGSGNGLRDDHRQDLLYRGFSDEEIERYGFYSVTPNQPTAAGASWAFPGVRDCAFCVFGDGYTVPFFNREGLVQGYQVRLDSTDTGRYRWAKGVLSSHRSIGGSLELPLTYIPASGSDESTVALVEGGLKALLAARRLSCPIIGAAAGQFATSPKQLKAMLEGARTAVLYPDGGDVLNPQVLQRWNRQVAFLKQLNLEVKFAWWGQVAKEGSDIDEIGIGVTIELLSPVEFEQTARKAQRAHLTEGAQKKLRSLSIAPTHAFDQIYLPDLLPLVPLSGILALKSPKGSGKSVQIRSMIAVARSAGMNVISITPRIALGREQAHKWGLDWFNDLADAGSLGALRGTLGLGICWDSLWRLADLDWSKTLIVVDEAELAVMHLLLSSTCRERRPKILHVLERKLGECLEGGGGLLLADADLSDVSLKYFSGYVPEATIRLIGNAPPQQNPWEVNFWTGSRGTAIAQAFDTLAFPVEEGDTLRQRRIAIATDSKDEARAIEASLLERYPDLTCVRIDSSTTVTDFGRDFVKRPDESIAEIEPQVLIYTPSMGAGVSIDRPWFDEVYGIFFGVIEPSQARQMLARIRQPVPRTIWAKQSGTLNATPTFLPHEVKDSLFAHHRETTILLDVVQAMAGDAESDRDLMGAYQRIWDEATQSWDNVHIDCYAELTARRHYGIAHFASLLAEELAAEGHDVNHCGRGGKTDDGNRVAQTKKEFPQQAARAIAEADDIPLEVAHLLQHKATTSEGERNQIAKALLKAELPGIELTPQFVYKAVTADRRRWLNAVRMFWFAAHPQEAVRRDRQTWISHLHSCNDGAFYLADIKTFSLQAACLNEIGLVQFIDLDNPNKLYSKDSPEIAALFHRARSNRRLKAAFGMTVSRKASPIFTANRLLEKVGLRLKYLREGKDRVRLYQLDTSLLYDSDRKAVLESLSRKAAQRQVGQAVETPAPFSVTAILPTANAADLDPAGPELEVTATVASFLNGCKENVETLRHEVYEAARMICSRIISGQALWRSLSEPVKEYARQS